MGTKISGPKQVEQPKRQQETQKKEKTQKDEALISCKESTSKASAADDKELSNVLNEEFANYEVMSINDISDYYDTNFNSKVDEIKTQNNSGYTGFDVAGGNLAELETKKTEIENNISSTQDELSSINNGTHEELQSAQSAVDEASQNYQKALDETQNPVVIELRDEIKETEEEKARQEQVVSYCDGEISQTQNDITSQESTIASLKSEIGSYESQISSVKSSISSCDDSDKKAKLQSRLSSLQELKGKAEAEKKTQEMVLTKLNEKLEKLNSDKKTAQDTINDTLIPKKEELEQKIQQTNDETLKAALDSFNEAKEAFEEQKQTLLTSVNEKISNLRTDLADIETQIAAEKQRLFEEQMKKEQEMDVQDQPDTVVPEAYSTGGASGMGGGSYSSASAAVQNQTTTQDYKANFDSANKELEADKNERNAIYEGKDSDLSALKQVSDSAFDSFISQVSDSALASEITSLKGELDSKEAQINEIDLKLAKFDDKTYSMKQNLEGVDLNLASLNSALDKLNDVDKSELDDEKLSQYKETKKSLEDEISSTKDSKSSLEDDIKEREKNGADKEEYDDLVKQRSELKKEYDEIYSKLQSKIKEAKGADGSKFIESYDKYQSSKEEKIASVNGKIKTDRTKANELYKTYAQSMAEDLAKKFGFANGDGEAVIDFARQFLGCCEANGSANKFVGGGSSSATPWCAAFVSYVLQNSGEYNDVADWYKNVGNKWYCQNIYDAAKGANAFVNSSQAQTGDLVLFDRGGDGHQDHIGIVIGVDSNGTVHTIEGNTSNQVAERTYNGTSGMSFARVFR